MLTELKPGENLNNGPAAVVSRTLKVGKNVGKVTRLRQFIN
jgi:hypothetical protein